MRISRSVWKFPYNPYNFSVYKNNTVILARNVTLTSKFLYKQFMCYKGKVVGKLEINKLHLGHKLGEFFLTKVLGERIAYRKRQKLLMKKAKNRMKLLKKR